MAKTKIPEMLNGAGNQLPHQYIISDLIYAVRKKNANTKNFKVLSEISLDQLGNFYDSEKFTAKHNYDFVILDAKTNAILLIAEIEHAGKVTKMTDKKLLESLLHIEGLKEVFKIRFDGFKGVSFERMEATKQRKLVVITDSSHSKLVGLNFKTSIVSLR